MVKVIKNICIQRRLKTRYLYIIYLYIFFHLLFYLFNGKC